MSSTSLLLSNGKDIVLMPFHPNCTSGMHSNCFRSVEFLHRERNWQKYCLAFGENHDLHSSNWYHLCMILPIVSSMIYVRYVKGTFFSFKKLTIRHSHETIIFSPKKHICYRQIARLAISRTDKFGRHFTKWLAFPPNGHQ